WLWTIARNKSRERARRESLRRGAPCAELPDLGADDPASHLANREFQAQLLQQALKVMQREFETTTWTACWEHVVLDRKAADVAEALGITVNAVYIAKSR